MCREFGEVASIYYPMDLRRRAPRGFAFVRFARPESAAAAVAKLHGANLGVGRDLTVTAVQSGKPSYFSQDESI